MDAEGVQQSFYTVGDLLEHRGFGDDDVCRQCRFGGRDGPDVDMVHIEHALLAFNLLLDILNVEPLGHGVGAHAQALAQQVPGADEDNHGDDQADDGVDDGPAGVVYHYAADDDAHADQRVGQHVQEGTTGVDVVLLLAAEGPGGEAVDDDAHGGGPDDEGAVDLGGVEELVDALHHDGAHGDQQDDGVEQRDEHRGFAVAVGEALGGGAGGQLEGYHGQQQREDVAQVVARVAQQSDAVAYHTGDGLDDDEGEVQRYGYYIYGRQALDVVAVVMMMVTVMVMLVVMFV